MNMNDVLARLSALDYSALEQLSKDTGVPHGTLVRLKYGQAKNPRAKTIEKLDQHFSQLHQSEPAAAA